MMRLITAYVVFAWFTLLLLGGPTSLGERAFFGASSILLAAIVRLVSEMEQGVRAREYLRAIGLFVLAAFLGFRFPNEDVRVVTFGVAAALALPNSANLVRYGILVGGVVWVAVQELPWVFWDWAGQLSSAMASTFGWSALTNCGPTAIGLPQLLWALLLLGLGAKFLGFRRSGVVCLFVLIAFGAQFLIADWLRKAFGPYSSHRHPTELFSSLKTLNACLAAVIGFGAVRAPSIDADSATAGVSDRRSIAKFCLTIAAGFLLVWLAKGIQVKDEPNRKVAFLNEGGVDWVRPGVEKIGVYESGMFGLLPIYLEDSGWETEALQRSELQTEILKEFQVLVIVNSGVEWSVKDIEVVSDFMASGGTVLALGDHTNVFGIMDGMNPFLEKFGIAFRFDSAYHAGPSWGGDLVTTDSVMRRWAYSEDLGVGIGASFDLWGKAKPIVMGRYGFSDIGYPDNVMGSFLGNYKHDPGERVGDLPIVVGSWHSKGRIFVYGDTSGFQNGSLAYSYRHYIQPVMDEFARRVTFKTPGWLQWLSAIAGAVLVGLLCRRRDLAKVIGLCVGAAAAMYLASPKLEAGWQVKNWDKTLLFDHSHLPEIGHYDSGWNASGPVITSALRTGLLAHDLYEWDAHTIANAGALVCVAPSKPFSSSEKEQLAAAVENGMTLVVAASGSYTRGSMDLLKQFGLTIEPISIGPVPPVGVQQPTEPKFLNPSALQYVPGVGDEVLYQTGEQVLALARPIGKGWVVVIGDTRFFSTTNVQDMQSEWPGNIRFLIDIMIQYCGGSLEGVEERFVAPEKGKK